MKKPCVRCGEVFRTTPHDQRRGRGKFCSLRCMKLGLQLCKRVRLSWTKALEIRRARTVKAPELAKQYGVSEGTIYAIWANRQWRVQ